MPMDAYRHENNLVLNFDLPGIDADTMELTVEKNVLKVTAQRTRPQADGAQWLASERPYGTFTCQLSLGEGVDVDALHAIYDNGVLSITVPVIEPVSRRIEIVHGAQAPESVETPAAA
jgi:HSP20 family protein